MYYFAYASNLSLAQMRRICGWHCRLLGRARLPDFEVGIGKRGFMNIRHMQGENTQGVLYEIDEDGLALMDEFENYPSVFRREEVRVYDEHNIKYKAQVYIEPPEQFGGQTVREEYFRRAIAAAKENHMDPDWIKKLEKLIEGKTKI